MEIAITGSGGFLGRAVAARLAADGHIVNAVSTRGARVELPASDAVIHLAGEPIAQRWSAETKRRIRDSRVAGTLRLVEAIVRLGRTPGVLLAASAVGYYGSRGDEVLTEDSTAGGDFLAEVCAGWEQATAGAAQVGARVVNLRIGMVLGQGGALSKMLPAFRLGAGGRLGSGRQWMSWIHLDDLVELIAFALHNPALTGPINATAANPVRNSEFTSTLAAVLHRPAFAVAPAFALRLMLGEMASVLLSSQRALPRAAQAAGFEFRYPDLGQALSAILG
jgi:uncharacterized protein